MKYSHPDLKIELLSSADVITNSLAVSGNTDANDDRSSFEDMFG